jgi:hypothetical protein
MPFDITSRPQIALSFHEKFYTSLASGSIQSLRPSLCPGLADKTQSQVAYRRDSKAPPQSWKIERYTSLITYPYSSSFFRRISWPFTSILPITQAKVVSDRIVPFPVGKDIYIRQCIVRIRSLQSLDKHDGTPPTRADLTEYLVLQQMNLPGQPVLWKMWGTTKPTTQQEMEDLIASDEKTKEGRMTLMDRIRALDPTKGF